MQSNGILIRITSLRNRKQRLKKYSRMLLKPMLSYLMQIREDSMIWEAWISMDSHQEKEVECI